MRQSGAHSAMKRAPMGHNKFEELGSMSLEEFVNSTITKFEPSVLQVELERCVAIKNEIEKELYNRFLEHSDKIMQALSLYDEMEESDFVYVDEEKQRELFSLFGTFSDDMRYFMSPTRYLVHYDMFTNGKNVLVILSNDLVFVAESETKTGFKLLNAFNYNVVDIKRDKKSLIIRSDNHHYRLTKNEEHVSKIVNVYEELTFEPESIMQAEEAESDGLEDLLIETEQYEKLQRIHKKIPQIYSKKELTTCLGKMDADVKVPFVTDFLNARFEKGLQKTNKIQPLKSLVDDTFAYFWSFQDEQEDILRVLEDDATLVGPPHRALLIEHQLGLVFKFLKKRVFYNFKIKANRDIQKLIERSLVRGSTDLRFFMAYFNFSIDDYFRGCIDNAKHRLESIVNETALEFSQ
ncbi:UNVERIFIED_CONTAM: hypothetical protein PYX00_011485 [Menopon gallinae]|uniref:Uncharacterized protein n=1 Tax=Menopon gallinae TaxID=328185 RepID=A0AAW2H7R4_9NEOP